MKKNLIPGILAALALFMAGACSNETIEQKQDQNILNTDENSGGVYLSVDFKLPNGNGGTRSETQDPDAEGNNNHFQSSGGEEVGSDAENFVSSALIVLAATEPKNNAGAGEEQTTQIKEYGLIVAGEVPSNRIATSNTTDGNKLYKAIARLQKGNLNNYYLAYTNEGKTVPNVYVFVFSNPTTHLLSLFDGTTTSFGDDSWLNKICEVNQSVNATENKNVGIWSKNSFLMNNVSFATRKLPVKLLDWENYSSVEKPFHLSDDNTGSVDNSAKNDGGPVLVERSVARFDFKDGSKKADGTANDNTYSVLFNTDANGDFDPGQPVVDVQIQKMCLVNMSKEFFYLPRVSQNGYDADVRLLASESPWTKNAEGIYTGGNYVVGPFAESFNIPPSENFSNYFNFPFFENNGSFNNEQMSADRWDVVKVEDVLKGTKDNYKGADGNGVPGQYRVWRYVTENAIPGGKAETQYGDPSRQVNGISTGVVFKAKLKGGFIEANKANYKEEPWEMGMIENLAACLDGKPFTYVTSTGKEEKTGIKGNSQDDPILFYYSGHLYMGWRHMRQAAIQASVSFNTAGHLEINRSNSIYKAVFGDGPIPPVFKMVDGKLTPSPQYYIKADGTSIELKDPQWNEDWPLVPDGDPQYGDVYDNYLESANYAWSVWAKDGKELVKDGQTSTELENMRAAVTGAGITIYQSSVDSDYKAGYYCYYYYWNRHNDNGLKGSMGPMEFAVVRNNVYKLSVDKISRLGHPRIPENDPNNPTPSTPDESDEIYLDVNVQIVPWIVRVNSIEF